MTVKEMIEKSVSEMDAELAGKAAVILRFHHGQDYKNIFLMFKEYGKADLTPAEFEGLMSEIER